MKTIIRHWLFFLFLIFFSTSIFSQTAEGFEEIQNEDFEAAIFAFEQDLDDKNLSPYAYYGLATIYADSISSYFDLEKAWTNYLSFNEGYKAASDKKKKKYKKDFKIRSSKLKSKITEAALTKTKNENTVEAYDHFLDFYKKTKSKYRNEVTQLRNQLAYNNALELDSANALEEFLEKYKKSLKSKSPELWKAGELKFFELTMKEKGWNHFDDFAKAHPKNPYVKDKAGKEYIPIHDLKDKEKFQSFLDNHPKSLYSELAKNQMVKLLVQAGTMDEFNWFLLSYPNHEAANDLWKKFFFMYKGVNGKESVVTFAQTYPQYPFPDELKKEVEAAQEAEAEKVFSVIGYSVDVNVLLEYLEKFPNSKFTAQIEAQLKDVLLKSAAPTSIENYLDQYPESEYREDLVEHLYELHIINLDLKMIEKFEEKYGKNFKDKERLAKDKALAEELVFLTRNDYFPDAKDKYDAFIKSTAPTLAGYIALYKILEKDLKSKNWEAAKSTMLEYQPYFKKNNVPYNQLLDVLQAPPRNVKLTKLGDAINSEGSEYAPAISADGQTLYFCAKRRNDNLGKEDIFISKKENGKWTPAKLMEGINTMHRSEAPEAISVDGTQMLMFRSGQLAYSNQTKSGWSNVEYLPTTINATKWQADASIASDGRAILFASRREDIIGFREKNNMDIYVCLKNENGEWGEVINLGEQINTTYIERAPFLHPDMKTLYFSSAGHGGLGLMDVFKTTRLDDTWTNWSTPINLGREINTANSDWGYKISTDGKTAYFSYATDESLNEDIYQVELPKEMRPQAVSTIAGVLKDSEGNPMDAEIIIEDLSTNQIVAELKSNPQTGQFFAVLPDNRKYSYYIKKENYFPISNNIDLSENQVVEINENLELFTVAELTEKGMNITLENIFFDTDKYILKPESSSELNRVFALIKMNDFQVELFGHTDSDGDTAYNITLSQNRANAVREYLIKKGIPAENISAEGLGESQPIDSNETAKGKAKNRRVEVRFRK